MTCLRSHCSRPRIYGLTAGLETQGEAGKDDQLQQIDLLKQHIQLPEERLGRRGGGALLPAILLLTAGAISQDTRKPLTLRLRGDNRRPRRWRPSFYP